MVFVFSCYLCQAKNSRVEEDDLKRLQFINKNKAPFELTRSEKILEHVKIESANFNIDADLMLAMIAQESGFYLRATSRASCLGLGQISKATWDTFNSRYVWPKFQEIWPFEDAYSLEKNIMATAWTISWMMSLSQINTTDDLLIAYNVGPWQKDPYMLSRGRVYRDKVMAYLKELS